MCRKLERYAWGALRAALTGGAHSLTPVGVVTVTDSKDFSPLHQLGHFALLAGCTFAASAGFEFFRYLANNPLPDFDPENANPIK